MNNVLKNTIDNTVPKFNKDTVDGASKSILKEVPGFLDEIIKSSMMSLSRKVDLQYLGYRRLTPSEEYNYIVNKNNNKTVYDLARSDLYMIELSFMYSGTPVKKQLYLPFTDKANLMHISQTTYSLTSVLSDTVISPSHKELFVRLLKDKLTYRSVTRNVIIDGEKVPKQVIHANILRVNKNQIKDNIGKPLTSPSLYLCGEYGLAATIKRYYKKTEVKVTTDNVDHLRDKYHVFESSKIKPRSLKEYGYAGHDLKILISKDVGYNSFIENLFVGLIYTLDILPEHTEDFVQLFDTGDVEGEKLFWRIMLGRIAYKNSYSVDRMVEDINDHFETLQGYMDTLIKNKLSENNIKVGNFFDLIAVILDKYNTWLINSKEYNSNIDNRYLDILYYVLYDIIVGFNKVILNLNKRSQKKEVSMREFNKIVANEISPRKIFGLVKSMSMNLTISLAETTSDIMYPKITALLEDRLVFSNYKKIAA